MDYAIVKVPAAPVRRKARHQAEMTNQLLFGDAVKILKQKGSLWVKVRSLSDNYEGWVTRTLLEPADSVGRELQHMVTSELINPLVINGQTMHVPIGATLPAFNDMKGKLGDLSFSYAGKFMDANEQVLTTALVKALTFQWLNAPYMWGGKTLMGVDCSGFVQVNYKMMGINLPRDAWQQAQKGETVSRLKQAVCGDLAFFDDKDEIVHVGVILGEDQIIHASGKVRIDHIDKKGIVNSETDKRTHSLRLIKRCR